LLYSSEAWTLKEQDESRIIAAEVKFLRKTAQYTLYDHKKNWDIIKELNTQSIIEKISKYKNKWMQHVRRMDRSRLLRAILEHRPAGTRNPGRPLKRLLDGYIEAGTGHKA
jgi:hypothetical protein